MDFTGVEPHTVVYSFICRIMDRRVKLTCDACREHFRAVLDPIECLSTRHIRRLEEQRRKYMAHRQKPNAALSPTPTTSLTRRSVRKHKLSRRNTMSSHTETVAVQVIIMTHHSSAHQLVFINSGVITSLVKNQVITKELCATTSEDRHRRASDEITLTNALIYTSARDCLLVSTVTCN